MDCRARGAWGSADRAADACSGRTARARIELRALVL